MFGRPDEAPPPLLPPPSLEGVEFARNVNGEMVADAVCACGQRRSLFAHGGVDVYIECGMRIRAEYSCTDREKSWLPAHIKKLQVRPVAEMDFASAAMKKRRLDDLGPSCSPK
ncbi:hypothetical protein HPB48_013143 [Haemaphysalis longicornis]|uniref:Uncharacterized protein n=1 Tax=Haemaphysalis longicornis TaxID=44386 RepID=A0A9J6GL65_HAELO|nr:hypothetical protein HPB48_013143 [Haemaphysalis longicornis]